MSAAQNLRKGRSQLIALVVSDLANPLFARIVWAAQSAVADWGYSLVVFNGDEKPENERRILARFRTLSCDGIVLVPVCSTTIKMTPARSSSAVRPTVHFGCMADDGRSNTVIIDNVFERQAVTNCLAAFRKEAPLFH